MDPRMIYFARQLQKMGLLHFGVGGDSDSDNSDDSDSDGYHDGHNCQSYLDDDSDYYSSDSDDDDYDGHGSDDDSDATEVEAEFDDGEPFYGGEEYYESGDEDHINADTMAIMRSHLQKFMESLHAQDGGLDVIKNMIRKKDTTPNTTQQPKNTVKKLEEDKPDPVLDNVVFTADGLSKLKLGDLKKLCKRKHLRVGGKKKELIARLVEFEKKESEKGVFQELSIKALNRLTIPQLQRLIESYTLIVPTRMKKRDMVQWALKEGPRLSHELDYREATKQMDDYFRGQVLYTLPPSVITKIFKLAFLGDCTSGDNTPESMKRWMRWKLSLGTISKWTFKNLSQIFTSISLSNIRTINAYDDQSSHRLLYRHILNPYCLLKTITKLSIYHTDYEQLVVARSPEGGMTDVQNILFGQLESLTITVYPYQKVCWTFNISTPTLPKLRSFKIQRHQNARGPVSLPNKIYESVSKIDIRCSYYPAPVYPQVKSFYTLSLFGKIKTLDELSQCTNLKKIGHFSNDGSIISISINRDRFLSPALIELVKNDISDQVHLKYKQQLSKSGTSRRSLTTSSNQSEREKEQLEEIEKEIAQRLKTFIELLKQIQTHPLDKSLNRQESLSKIPPLLGTWRKNCILFTLNTILPESLKYRNVNIDRQSWFYEWLSDNNRVEHLSLGEYHSPTLKAAELSSNLHILQIYQLQPSFESIRSIFQKLASDAPSIDTLILYIPPSLNTKLLAIITRTHSFSIHSLTFKPHHFYLDQPVYKVVLKK